MDPDVLQLLIYRIKVGIVTINGALDIIVPVVVVFWLSWVLIKYVLKKVEKDGLGKGIYFASLAFFETSLVILVLFIVQWVAVYLLGRWVDENIIRWGLIYIILIPAWYLLTRKNSGLRGVYSLFFILTSFLIGWFYDRWVGILFITIPLLALFFHITRSFAQIILPVNDPENKDDQRQRTKVFLKYMLGIQYPMWVAKTKTERTLEKRIEGNNIMRFGKPGVIYTWSHQVTGLSNGIEFNRVGGPGVTFTAQLENPIALVDLRTQLRVCRIDAVTKDGMEIKAVVFAAFAVNRDSLSKRFYAEMRHATGRDFKIDHPDGRYSYSSGRIYSLLSTAGINTNPVKDGQKPEFFWDEWVVKQIEHAAREVVSDRTLDELWRPRIDNLGSSALDEMADAMKKIMSSKLTDAGVILFTVRIVNYDIEKKPSIAQQNIKTWSSYWEQKVTEATSAVEMVYREEIENAHAYAKSILLGVVTDSMNEAREIHPDLPRYVIAQYYIHALEEVIKGQPGLNMEESKKRLENIKDLLFYRTEGSE